jgi:hypothetical protein
MTREHQQEVKMAKTNKTKKTKGNIPQIDLETPEYQTKFEHSLRLRSSLGINDEFISSYNFIKGLYPEVARYIAKMEQYKSSIELSDDAGDRYITLLMLGKRSELRRGLLKLLRVPK